MNNISSNVTVIPATVTTAAISNDKYHQLRVAAYCRVSTAQEEQLNSYQVQIDYYTELINKKKEWKLAGIFADEGISGTQTKKRTEFNRMIRMCKQKKIDLILCKSISRFARNTVDCLEYVRQLKDLGIGVLFEKENINTLKMTSEFMIALYGSFAQAESESISKNITWGNQKAFEAGKVRYNYKCWLGYKKGADGKPEIVPEEADIVKRIYNLYLDGMSLETIVNELKNAGIHTKSGKKWSKNRIQNILKNEKYVGDVLLQKTYTIDCISHKSVKNNGERPKYLVSNAHEPIIDRDTYNLAQQEMARRSAKRKKSDKTKTEQGKYSSKYALSEIMVCAECGSAYRRVIWNIHGKRKQAVWRCLNRLDHGNRYCKKSPSLYEENLHRAILQAINKHYGCEEVIKKILESNIEAIKTGDYITEIQEAEKRLRELDNARNEMISLITSGTVDEDSLDDEFHKIYEEEQHLKERVDELKDTHDNNEEALQNDKSICDIYDSGFELKEYDDILVRKLIECVRVVDKERVEVVFKGEDSISTAYMIK